MLHCGKVAAKGLFRGRCSWLGEYNSLSAHGNAIGKWSQKNTPCKGTLACPVHSKSWRHHGAPLQGLRFYNGSNPWRCHGLRVHCPFGAETLRLFRILQKTRCVAMGCECTAPSGRKRSDYSAFFRKPAATSSKSDALQGAIHCIRPANCISPGAAGCDNVNGCATRPLSTTAQPLPKWVRLPMGALYWACEGRASNHASGVSSATGFRSRNSGRVSR